MNINSKKLTLPLSDPVNFNVRQNRKSHLNDSSLWHQFQLGDESAFVEIYKLYANHLYHYGCQFSADKELVKDCLQDFFIYLRKNRGKFSPTDSIKFYLMRSFKRIIFKSLKKSIRTEELYKNYSFKQLPVELSSEAVLINLQIEDAMKKKLSKALSELKEKERAAIYYFFYKGLRYEQIASIFGYSQVSSGRRLIYSALVHLRTLFILLIVPGLIFCDKL